MNQYRQTGFRVARKNRATVRATAHEVISYVRNKIGWTTTPFPIVPILEYWGSESGTVVGRNPPNFDVFTPSELPHADAEFVPHLNLIRVRESVWDAASSGDPSAKWALAHEVGHAVLMHHVAAGLYADDHRVNPETDSESQANWFADELLMDCRLISQLSGTRALTQLFGVSEVMAARRIKDLILEARLRR